ncbi:imidazoleglycerol-phosphate dehydratase, chloroplastic-like isoform X11 [Magnolia sinica]|uniref:imidazoleglycerol-phosphate dehydratase, chloroplastic-like isoform X11 n=1 Tax=Magnolia sinica TaxID=86752 RepID=UPI002657D1D8|nr:imidazoleglycerol-phosphate dehydratase, chloroplastic-like isoform X11 [Magnolia sinica]
MGVSLFYGPNPPSLLSSSSSGDFSSKPPLLSSSPCGVFKVGPGPLSFPKLLLLRKKKIRPMMPLSSLSCESQAAAQNGSPNTAGRFGEVKRVTKETDVLVKLNLDGSGIADCSTDIPFLDHMLDALLQALGDRKGINRFGDFSAPLDEALVHVSLDLSGRPHLSYDLNIPTERVGTYDTQLVEHFFQSLVNTSGMTLHIRQLAGKNSHHIIEATFKAFARALRQATEYDPRRRGSVPRFLGNLDLNWDTKML